MPSPMAFITVAAPEIMSPPAYTPLIVVSRVSGFTTTVHLSVTFMPSVHLTAVGLGLWPMATITVSASTVNSSPVGIGLLLPDSSGGPSRILIHLTFRTHPFSPRNSVG